MDDKVRAVLLPGEHVLWEGKPGTDFIFRPIELFLIPFSLLWGGFALFSNVTAWSSAGDSVDWFFKLWGLPFLVAGVYIIFGRFWLDSAIRRGLRYFVTDRRILIQRRSRNTVKLDLKRLPALELEERGDGSGTIRFGTGTSWLTGNGFGIWQPTFDPTPQFMRIERVRHVYDLICRQQDQAA